jgi:hypothetical protein
VTRGHRDDVIAWALPDPAPAGTNRPERIGGTGAPRFGAPRGLHRAQGLATPSAFNRSRTSR